MFVVLLFLAQVFVGFGQPSLSSDFTAKAILYELTGERSKPLQRTEFDGQWFHDLTHSRSLWDSLDPHQQSYSYQNGHPLVRYSIVNKNCSEDKGQNTYLDAASIIDFDWLSDSFDLGPCSDNLDYHYWGFCSRGWPPCTRQIAEKYICASSTKILEYTVQFPHHFRIKFTEYNPGIPNKEHFRLPEICSHFIPTFSNDFTAILADGSIWYTDSYGLRTAITETDTKYWIFWSNTTTKTFKQNLIDNKCEKILHEVIPKNLLESLKEDNVRYTGFCDINAYGYTTEYEDYLCILDDRSRPVFISLKQGFDSQYDFSEFKQGRPEENHFILPLECRNIE